MIYYVYGEKHPNSNNKSGVQQIMSILNNNDRAASVKNAAQAKFAKFFANADTKANAVEKETKVEDSVYLDLKETTQGSIPNRLVSLALSAGAAYVVGLNPCYIAITVAVTGYFMFLLPGTSRLIFEASLLANLLIIALATLPETAVTALEYLMVFKLLLELLCLAFDRLTQFYAVLTADKKHSYYLFLTLFIFLVKVCVVYVNPFLNGFVDGFQSGISGM